jgi:hypothetical protein
VWVRGVGEPVIGAIPVLDCMFDEIYTFRQIAWVGTAEWVKEFIDAADFGLWRKELGG